LSLVNRETQMYSFDVFEIRVTALVFVCFIVLFIILDDDDDDEGGACAFLDGFWRLADTARRSFSFSLLKRFL